MSNKHPRRTLQLLALLELALLAGAVVTGLILAFRNAGLLLLYAVFLVLLAVGGWVMFSGTGGRRRLGIFLAVGGILGLMASTLALARESVWLILLLAGLTIAYTALASVIASRYWAGQRAGVAGPNRFHRPWLVVNPKSGDGRAIKADIPDKARAMGIQVHVTEAGDDIVALSEQAVADGADVLGVSGGDGTLAAVATVAMKHNLPLVVLAGGTKCHFAKDIGLSPDEIALGLDGFTGVDRRVDVAEINGRTFLNNASFGVYAMSVIREDYRGNKAGVTRQVARDLVTSDQPYFPLHYIDDDGTRRDHAAVIQVGVNPVETFNLAEVGSRKRMDKGVLHVIVVPELDNQMAAQLGARLVPFGGQGGLREWTTTSFEVSDPTGKVPAGVDGETIEFDSPVQIRIKPQALRLSVPAAGRTARRIKPFSRDAVRALGNILAGRA
jgi:diacylglycerol kinase family enzyme